MRRPACVVEDSAFVYILKTTKDGKDTYEKTYVQLGLSDGIYVEVLSGITSEDKLRGKIKVKMEVKKRD